ncbi:DUF5681 domain-containing protein [Sphingomonas sp. ERG5]|uniref:DUF5681 domain-containing protein n=1 Tax=Sphingomonas sp. ERG5 TaxID=1381597 RepID=UPI00054B2648|nr:DUF5681 domain-containing protein [Sphingomonas sp. ERG5]
MTMPEGELNREDAGEAVGATGDPAGSGYCVGYGKPPIEHRFAKGNRANPGGKRRRVLPADTVLPQLTADSVHEMLVAEARRMVRVKAGGRMVEIPALQAAFRAVAMRAARGNRLAMATMTQLVMRSDATERRAAPEPASATAPATATATGWFDALRTPEALADAPSAVEAAGEYKAIWTRVLTKAATLGAALAAPTPHPDDITIGLVKGVAHWPGSLPGEMLSLDRLATMHAELQAELPARRPAIEAMREGYDKAAAWCGWFALDDVRALIAEHLPERYAGQIEPDMRPPEERVRDRSLRSLARYDRERHESLRAWDAAARTGAEAAGDAVTPPGHDGMDDGAPEAGRTDGRETGPGDAAECAASTAMPVMEAAAVAEPGPAPTVAESSTYQAAWLEMLHAAQGMEVGIEAPMPPPDDVIIDAETETVTYRTPPTPGRYATLASLRTTLARLTADAARHQRDANWAGQPLFATRSSRRRDEVLALCAVIERHLAGHEGGARGDGGG